MLGFLTWILTFVVPFLFVITIVIAIHELGHFLAARLCGVKVERFSLGFGKTLAAFTDRSGVEWRLASLPLGGYVKFAGDANIVGVPDKEDLAQLRREIVEREGPGAEKKYYHFKNVWQRAFIVAAGPLANFVLAVGIFAVLFGLIGEQVGPARVIGVEPGSVAARAGFQKGDVIRTLDGRAVRSHEAVVQYVRLRPQTQVDFGVDRGGRTIDIKATPRRGSISTPVGPQDVGQLGVVVGPNPSEVRWVRYGPVQAVQRGTEQCRTILTETLTYLGRIATGKESGDQLSGPIRTAAMSGAVTKEAVAGPAPVGLKALNLAVQLFNLIAFISVSVGFLNLLPVPVLDGGHLLFYAYEAVARKPLGAKVQEAGYRVGLALLLGLMLFATWNDLQKLSVFKILGGLLS
jgi:regulator of sigma E protease